jgi:hypothetical protein
VFGKVTCVKDLVRVLALLLACAPARAFAQDAEPPEIHEEACALPDGRSRKLVTTRSAPMCGQVCSREQSLAVVDANEQRVFGVSETLGEDEAGITLSCGSRGLTLALDGEELHVLVDGRLRLDSADARAIRGSWREPSTGKAERITRLQTLQALIRIALDAQEQVVDLEQELADVLELVEARERIASGDFEGAQATLAHLGFRDKAKGPRAALPLLSRPFGVAFGVGRAETPLSPESRRRRAELLRLLETTRKKSTPVKFGTRRLVGSAPRLLRGPSEVGEVPTLFFEGGKLCIADVKLAPYGVRPETLPPPSSGRMRCFPPSGSPPAADEVYRAPASSGERVKYRDFTSPYNQCRGMVVAIQPGTPEGPHPCQGGPGVPLEDVLAIVDRDAILALGTNGLELVRGPGKVENVARTLAAAIVARSAGTRLLAASSSYFLTRGRLARVGESEEKTWTLLGPPPAGVYWIGIPVVSPDQRWVAAQSGNGDRDVKVWVFPVR